MDLNLEIIKDIIDHVDRSGLSSFRLETESFKLCLEKPLTVSSSAPAALPEMQAATCPASEKPAAPAVNAQPKVCGNIVTSPIVGTFYAAAAPEKPPLVKVGQHVQKGDVLFIVESMKLMNEITSEYEGTVEEIFVKDGQSLEYGQPILRIV